jgi:hypothetical protein
MHIPRLFAFYWFNKNCDRAPLRPEQSRAARAWLGWSQTELARRARVCLSIVRDFETHQRTPIANNLTAMQQAIEQQAFVLFFIRTVLRRGFCKTMRILHLDLSGANPQEQTYLCENQTDSPLGLYGLSGLRALGPGTHVRSCLWTSCRRFETRPGSCSEASTYQPGQFVHAFRYCRKRFGASCDSPWLTPRCHHRSNTADGTRCVRSSRSTRCSRACPGPRRSPLQRNRNPALAI